MFVAESDVLPFKFAYCFGAYLLANPVKDLVSIDYNRTTLQTENLCV